MEKIKFKSIKRNLHKVLFERLEDAKGKFKMRVSDKVSITDVADTSFTLMYERKIRIVPEKLFKIDVSFEIVCESDDFLQGGYFGNRDKIREFAEKSKHNIAKNVRVASLASTIIANLTVHKDMNPVITPAFFIDEKMMNTKGNVS